MRLLVVEDERELAALIRRALEQGGFAVDLAPDLAQTEDHLALARYDTVILISRCPTATDSRSCGAFGHAGRLFPCWC